MAACAVVSGPPNENHVDAITPLEVVDTETSWGAVFRRMPAVGKSHTLIEARAVEEYNIFFQGQVQKIARPLSERYAAWPEPCTPLPPWIDKRLSMGLRLRFKTKPPPFNGIRVGSHEPTGCSVTLCRDTRAPGKKGLLA